MNNSLIKSGLLFLIIFAFIITLVTPIVVCISSDANEGSNTLKTIERAISVSTDNLTDHIWQMQGYNRQHIGRSPYSTTSNPGIEKWRFAAGDWTDGSPVIDKDGTIYFGAGDAYLYAIYPNGTLKWKFEAERGIGEFGISPAIADDGTIYFSTKFGSYIQAVYPNGTAKWKRWTPDIDTSITIGNDGVIYYGHRGGVDARYPNGTLKWRFSPDDVVQSTPAINDNGTLYFGSHDDYVYALYPNGTIKWRFKTGGWVHGSPTIGNNGIVYVVSDDDYLYALFPNNGTMKWKVKVGVMRASPSLDKNGNLYFGVSDGRIYSVSPNGTIRWRFDLRDRDSVWGSTTAISDDGTVYVGNNINYDFLGGGEIIALNPDGSLKWRKIICNSVCESSPVISEDGVVYICSSTEGPPEAWGYLHAFGPQESNSPPEKPTIKGPNKMEVRAYHTYKFSTVDPDNNPVSYLINWGDGTKLGWTQYYESGLVVPEDHLWIIRGIYRIKVKARDTFGGESDWAHLDVMVPKNHQTNFILLIQWFLERHPRMFPILRQLLDLSN